jgi:heptosyltransferase II
MTRVLIVAPAWVGDMVMTESLVAAIRRREPDAIVNLLAPPWTAPIGERMAGVAASHEIASIHGRFDLVKRIRLGVELRAEDYDLAIVLPRSLKSAIAPFLAKIATRRGYLGEMRYGLLNDARRLDKTKLPRTIDRFVALANDGSGTAPAVTAPVLRYDTNAAKELAKKLGIANENRPIVALCPGAEFGPSKQWPASHFAAFSASLTDRGFASWIFGSENDRPIAEEIVNLVAAHGKKPKPVNLCGKTGLVEALDLMSLSACVVSTDSGLMHIAAAIGRPLVALFGSSSAKMTPPLAKEVRLLERDLPCRPCFKRECPLGHLDCLNLISATEVADTVEELIGPNSAKASG